MTRQSFNLACPQIRGTIPAAAHDFTHHSRFVIHDSERAMAKQAVARTIDLEPIDRLEEKIGRLVSMIGQLRSEQAQALDANARLTSEIEQLRMQLSDAEQVNSELAVLRDERDVIRTRVSEMLQQLEAI
jgi:regulator of replication initiation timing